MLQELFLAPRISRLDPLRPPRAPQEAVRRPLEAQNGPKNVKSYLKMLNLITFRRQKPFDIDASVVELRLVPTRSTPGGVKTVITLGGALLTGSHTLDARRVGG